MVNIVIAAVVGAICILGAVLALRRFRERSLRRRASGRSDDYGRRIDSIRRAGL